MTWWRSSLYCFFGGDWSYLSVIQMYIDVASHTALAVWFMQLVFGVLGGYCLHLVESHISWQSQTNVHFILV